MLGILREYRYLMQNTPLFRERNIVFNTALRSMDVGGDARVDFSCSPDTVETGRPN